MHITSEPIFLYSRTKLGTFTLVKHDKVIQFPDLNDSDSDNVVNVVNLSSLGSKTNLDDPRVKGTLSKLNLNSDHLSTSEISELTDVIIEYIDICQTEGGPRGNYLRVKHKIDPKNHPPIRSKAYRYAPHIQVEIIKQVHEMLEQDVIRKSTSP